MRCLHLTPSLGLATLQRIHYPLSSSHLVILSSCHLVILSSCHLVILSSCHPVILSSCHLVNSLHRHSPPCDDVANDRFRAVGTSALAVVLGQNAMREYGASQAFDVVGDNVIATFDERQGLGGTVKSQRSPCAGSQ